MKKRKLTNLFGGIVLLVTALPAFGLTYTWDGGGANDTFSTAANWNPDGSPLTNISSTDIIFAGTSDYRMVRLLR